jgi:hypothetical protein
MARDNAWELVTFEDGNKSAPISFLQPVTAG